jgi:hypothetical protein
MIKIQFIFGNQGTEVSEPQPLLKYNLEKYYIKIVKKNPDLLFIHNRLLNNSHSKIPKVIVERADSSVIFHEQVRELIRDDKTLAIIKTTATHDKSLNNSLKCNRRYHCYIINQFANILENEPTKNFLDEKSLKKIHCLIPTSVQNRFYWYKEQPPKKNKPIDVSFVGVTSYPNIKGINVMDWHRNKLVEELKKINGINLFYVTSEAGKSHPLKEFDYKNVVQKSKIIISPWGMGEWNYRDFHAMYQNCILIKPDSSHVECYPVDIFANNERYVPCKIDFSNLKQKIESILDEYKKYQTMMEKNRDDLVKSWDFQKLSEEFAFFVFNIIEPKKMFL